jgi:hypothetical protein
MEQSFFVSVIVTRYKPNLNSRYYYPVQNLYLPPSVTYHINIYFRLWLHMDFSSGLSAEDISNKKFWKELLAYFPLIRQGMHTKLLKLQFFYCFCVFVASVTIFKEPSPTKDMEKQIQTQTDGKDF